MVRASPASYQIYFTARYRVAAIMLFDIYPFFLAPMVKITNDTSAFGDSGGGWSWGETAWGVHAGRSISGAVGYFSDLERIESYFGLTVKRLPL